MSQRSRLAADDTSLVAIAWDKHLELVETRQTVSTAPAGRNAETKNHEDTLGAVLEEYGTVAQLRKLAAAEDRLEDAIAIVKAFDADYEEKVVTPERLRDHASKRVREFDDQLNELRTKVTDRLVRIAESAAKGDYSLLADTEIDLTRKQGHIETLRSRAEGAKLLRDLVLAREKHRSAVLARPIQELVNRWLRLLTDDNYDTLKLDHDLRPTGVHMVRHGVELPLASLSHGAQEQKVVLLRLGIAVLVSGEQRNPVLIDDRLVNADPIRMRRLCLILEEAVKACQIVIATCNDTPYAGLEAHTIAVPGHRALVQAPVL